MNKITQRPKTHFLPLIVLTAITISILYFVWETMDAITFITDTTGYISLFLIVVSLVVGPVNLLLKRKNPVLTYIRRDIEIYGGVLAVVHSITGLFFYLRSYKWKYFFDKTEHAYSEIRNLIVLLGYWPEQAAPGRRHRDESIPYEVSWGTGPQHGRSE